MKWMLLLGAVACGTATHVSAVCTQAAIELNYDLNFDVKNYEGQSSVPATEREQLFSGCVPSVNARAVFNASQGEFSSNSPFRVDLKLNQNRFSPETKAWLEQNLEIAFGFKDAADGAKEIKVQQQKTDYPILPGSPIGSIVVVGGEEYFSGARGTGILSFGLSLYQLIATLKFVTSPTSKVVTEINREPLRIKIGELTIKRQSRNTQSSNKLDERVVPMYLQLNMKIKIPTCTMRDINVDLGTANVGQLKSNTVANSQDFKVEFHCEALPSKAIYARITDAFNPSHGSENGVLLNQPTLSSAATDVGVQLLTDKDQPLMIGSRAPFLPTDGSAAPTYRKALKARLYSTGLNPSVGYVKAQATVLLDYE